MDTLTIFLTQFILSLLVYSLLARYYALPWLNGLSLNAALAVLLIPHTTRYLGLSFLVPGLVDGPPSDFAAAAAYGDFISSLLAVFAFIALRNSWKLALPAVLVFNLIGTFDLLNALRQVEAVPHLGVMWFVPTFWVPVLLVTHGLIFLRLYQHVVHRSVSRAPSGELAQS